MFCDLQALVVGPQAAPPVDGPGRAAERATPMARWFALMLDEIDYGMLLLADADQVVHMNHVARSELDAQHPLQLLGLGVRARRPQDVAPLRSAIDAAVSKRCRSLVQLGDEEGQRVTVAVIPLPSADDDRATLMVFGKRRVCQELSVHGFARCHGLTLVETQVLQRLCAGARPVEIATRQGVAMSTVRTHINNIRQKTGADSIRSLVRQAAALPPMVSALREAMH